MLQHTGHMWPCIQRHIQPALRSCHRCQGGELRPAASSRRRLRRPPRRRLSQRPGVNARRRRRPRGTAVAIPAAAGGVPRQRPGLWAAAAAAAAAGEWWDRQRLLAAAAAAATAAGVWRCRPWLRAAAAGLWRQRQWFRAAAAAASAGLWRLPAGVWRGRRQRQRWPVAAAAVLRAAAPQGHAPGQCGQPEPSGAPGSNNSGFGSGAPPSYQPPGPQYGGYPSHGQAPPPGPYGQQPQGGYGAPQQPQSGYVPPPSGMGSSTGFGGASSGNVEAMSGAQLRAFIQARSPRADTEDMERADLVAIAQALA